MTLQSEQLYQNQERQQQQQQLPTQQQSSSKNSHVTDLSFLTSRKNPRRATASVSSSSSAAAAAATVTVTATTAAAAAVSSSSAFSNDTPPAASAPTTDPQDVWSCRSCVDLLREAVLRRPNSRPYQLLQALLTDNEMPLSSSPSRIQATAATSTTLQQQPLYNTSVTTSATSTPNLVAQITPDGLQVQIPADNPLIPKRRWSKLDDPPEMPLHMGGEEEKTVIATTKDDHSAAISSSTSGDSLSVASTLSASLHRLATSASLSTPEPPPPAVATTANRTDDNRSKLEWLQLTCRKCSDTGPEGGARAFVMGPQPLSVVVCHNRLQQHQQQPSPALASSASNTTGNTATTNARYRAQQLLEMEEILTHELTHVYDVRKLQLDLRDCENLAYSEVRAARAAECATSSTGHNNGSSSSSWYWSNPLHTAQQRSCVRHKAVTATHNLFPSPAAQACLSKVFEKAFADQRPVLLSSQSSSTRVPSPLSSSAAVHPTTAATTSNIIDNSTTRSSVDSSRTNPNHSAR